MEKEMSEFFSGLFQQLLDVAKEDVIKDVLSTYVENDWTEKDENLRGVFTFVGNIASDVGELELSKMAREMRDECEPYFPS